MRKAPIRFSSLVLVVAFGVLTGCRQEEAPQIQLPSDPWGVVRVPAAEPIRIGLSLSVGDQMLGQESLEMERGAQIAVDEFGSITGKDVELVAVDTACT